MNKIHNIVFVGILLAPLISPVIAIQAPTISVGIYFINLSK
ncbi:MAG: hypothetical protein ACK48B_17310 [Dolichospermum sp.]